MCPDKIIRRFAGAFIIASLVLAVVVNHWWLLFTAFVGANLFQSSITGICPLERVLGRTRLFGCVPRGRAS